MEKKKGAVPRDQPLRNCEYLRTKKKRRTGILKNEEIAEAKNKNGRIR
jgi:hypothetical protein